MRRFLSSQRILNSGLCLGLFGIVDHRSCRLGRSGLAEAGDDHHRRRVDRAEIHRYVYWRFNTTTFWTFSPARMVNSESLIADAGPSQRPDIALRNFLSYSRHFDFRRSTSPGSPTGLKNLASHAYAGHILASAPVTTYFCLLADELVAASVAGRDTDISSRVGSKSSAASASANGPSVSATLRTSYASAAFAHALTAFRVANVPLCTIVVRVDHHIDCLGCNRRTSVRAFRDSTHFTALLEVFHHNENHTPGDCFTTIA